MSFEELIVYCEIQGWSVYYPNPTCNVLRLFNEAHRTIIDNDFEKTCMIEVFHYDTAQQVIHMHSYNLIDGTRESQQLQYLTKDAVETFLTYR